MPNWITSGCEGKADRELLVSLVVYLAVNKSAEDENLVRRAMHLVKSQFARD